MNSLGHHERWVILRRVAEIVSMMDGQGPSEHSGPSDEWLALSDELTEMGLQLMDIDGFVPDEPRE